MKYKDINFGTDEEFIALYEKLKSAPKVAKELGCGAEHVRKHAKEINYQIPNARTYKLTEQDKIEILEAYQTETSTALAKKYGVSRGMITKLWYDYDLKGKERRSYYFNKQDFFNIIDTEEKAYLLGFLAADGCVYDSQKGNKQKVIRIAINKKDIEILNYFQKYFDTNKPITEFKREEHEYVTFEVSSNQMANDLAQWNVVPKKTYKIIWTDLPTSELQFAYIRGYFDGDGSITNNIVFNNLHSVCVSIAGYEKNLNYFQSFLKLNGINCVFIQDNRSEKYTIDKSFGNLSFINKTEKVNFLKKIYPKNAKIYLKRKFDLAQQFIELVEQYPKTWTIKK